jgi:hypothetical protein
MLASVKSELGLEKDAEEDLGNAKVLHQELITATHQTTSAAQAGVFASKMKQNAIVTQLTENTVEFSPLSQSSFACCLTNEANSIITGNKNRDDIYQDGYNSIYNYNNQTNKYETDNGLIDALSRSDGDQIVKATNLFPVNENISATNINTVVESVIVMTNPTPFPASSIDTPSGVAYGVLKRIKNAQIAVPQQALMEVVSNKIGQYNVYGWASEIEKSIDAGPHPYVKHNSMSADGILALQTEARYSNPSWLIDLHRKPDAGLLREFAIMKSINHEYQRRILQSREKEVFMTASMGAQRTNMVMMPLLDKAHLLAINEVRSKKEMVASNEK